MSGVWLGASRILGRPVPVDEDYPHIHNARLPSGELLLRRDCAACATEQAARKETQGGRAA